MSKQLSQYQLRLTRYLSDLEASGKSLPGIRERINNEAVARAANLSAQVLRNTPELQTMLQEAVSRLGIEDQGRIPRLRPKATLQPGRPTYGELKREAPAFFVQSGISEASLGSYHSALEGWKRFFDLTDSDEAEAHLGQGFNVSFPAFAATANAPVCSRIRRWADFYIKLAQQQSKLPDNFADALNVLIESSNFSRNTLSDELRISHTSINEWVNGRSLPTTAAMVTQMEQLLGAAPGALMALYAPLKRKRLDSFRKVPEDWWPAEWQVQPDFKWVPQARNRRTVLGKIPEAAFLQGGDTLKRAFEESLDAVRALVRVNSPRQQGKYSEDLYGHQFRLWNSNLLRAWESLKQYKMAEAGFHNSERNGRWKESSANKVQGDLVYFFGYLTLLPNPGKPTADGKGMSHDELSLAHLTFSSLVADFLEFKRARSGAFNSGTTTFINLVAALTRPQSGWLWLHPELAGELPEELRSQINACGGWQQHCEQSRNFLLGKLKSFEKGGSIKISRDPFKPILPLLEMDHPLAPIIHGLKLHRRDLEIVEKTQGVMSLDLAVEWRDHLLVSFLTRFPLRLKHWWTMTYRHDGTGHLRRNSRGWELALPYKDFKNYANTKIFERRGRGILILDFSLPKFALLNQLSDLIDDYIGRCWSVLSGEKHHLLFPSRDGTSAKLALYPAVRQWTREHISEMSMQGYGIAGVRPFGPHAFRDLGATELIKNASIDDAAALLLDSRQMVEKHYARFIPADRVTQAFGSLSSLFENASERL